MSLIKELFCHFLIKFTLLHRNNSTFYKHILLKQATIQSSSLKLFLMTDSGWLQSSWDEHLFHLRLPALARHSKRLVPVALVFYHVEIVNSAFTHSL